MSAESRSTPVYRGVPMPDIDLTTNTWTPEERARTVRWYELAHGTGDTRLARVRAVLIDHNPAGFKRYRSLVPTLTGAVPRGIFFVHLYAVIGNANGCLYEIIASRQNGFIKQQVVDVLNFSFLTGGPQGINAVAESARRICRRGRTIEPRACSRGPTAGPSIPTVSSRVSRSTRRQHRLL